MNYIIIYYNSLSFVLGKLYRQHRHMEIWTTWTVLAATWWSDAEVQPPLPLHYRSVDHLMPSHTTERINRYLFSNFPFFSETCLILKIRILSYLREIFPKRFFSTFTIAHFSLQTVDGRLHRPSASYSFVFIRHTSKTGLRNIFSKVGGPLSDGK